MKILKRETWPEIMDAAEVSVLLLAPWIDEKLVTELFQFIPPVRARVLFTNDALQQETFREFRFYLREAMDINLDLEIRVTDDEVPACLEIDGKDFYYSQAYAELLRAKGGTDAETGIAVAEEAWERGKSWS